MENEKEKQREEHLKFLALLNRKQIFSRHSGAPVIFVENIDDDTLPKDKAYSDGIALKDYVGDFEDDIQQMYCVLKNGLLYNMEDFYTENYAFENKELFMEAIEKLIADKKTSESKQ